MCIEGPAEAPHSARKGGIAIVSLAALGIVYGDIGTSPLYAFRECFGEHGSIPVSKEAVLGVLSLMLWTLVVVVSVKYLVFILRADNHGEGGVLALTALIIPKRRNGGRWRNGLIGAGLFAAALLYGDALITPAISVLSAVEGLGQLAPTCTAYVVPITVGVLVALFAVQRRGTATIGKVFGPIVLLWFFVIGALGLRSILAMPDVMAAINPLYGIKFLAHWGIQGLLVMSAVFLVTTGAEAMYADMGHFGPRAIRVSWFVVALPGLTLNYLGQGALVLQDPGAIKSPFYSMVPPWALAPIVVLATLATIIASQAVISGAFSLTRQAVLLGYLPRQHIIHTSSEAEGQIYAPSVNWLVMVVTVAIVIGFKSSSALAAAYGVAVATTMLITTLLFFVLARDRWHWSLARAGAVAGLFLVLDVTFFVTNMTKIAHGAWLPLMVALLVYLVFSTWRKGHAIVCAKLAERTISLERFRKQMARDGLARVPGCAVYLAGHSSGVPAALVRNLRHNHVLHETIVFLTLLTRPEPRVESTERVTVSPLGDGIYRVVVEHGFMEAPDAMAALRSARKQGLPIKLPETSFFLGREVLIPLGASGMSPWRERLFVMLQRNALDATTFFKLPPDNVVEMGAHLEI